MGGPATVFDNGVLVNVERMLFGIIIIVLLIREPEGLAEPAAGASRTVARVAAARVTGPRG